MIRDFQRVAIVNRGAAALRFIHAVREFNEENGTSLRTVALYDEADRPSLFVREADEAVPLTDAERSHAASSGYFDYGALEKVLLATHADAVWAGWGFIAEHPELADLCQELGVLFIGPSAEVMRRLSDRIAVKRLAEQLHIPVAPWSNGPVETLKDAQHHGTHLGYPLLLKAATRNGAGAVLVERAGELPSAFEKARTHFFRSYGNPTIFLEKLMEGAREIRVQVIADDSGTTWLAGLRERAIPRQGHEVVYEAPPFGLTETTEQRIRDAAFRLSRAVVYSNVGCVCFLYQPATQNFALLEMKAALGPDHPVVECTSGLDVIKLQIRLARGERLSERPPTEGRYAVQATFRVEDAANRAARIERLRIATGPGLNVDCGVIEGECLLAEDGYLASVTAQGETRAEAFSRLARATRESVIVVEGQKTNKASVLASLEFLSRNSQKTSDEFQAKDDTRRDMGLIAAAIQVYEDELSEEITRFYGSASRGRPQVSSEVGRKVELLFQGQRWSVLVLRSGPQSYRLKVGTTNVDVCVERADRFELWLSAGGQRRRVVVFASGRGYRIEVDGVGYDIERGDRGIVRAPAPAVVASVAVTPGQHVSVGERLAILEAMKLEMEVKAEISGWVRHVNIIPNVQVEPGAPLMQIEEEISSPDEVSEITVVASHTPQATATPTPPWLHDLSELKQLLLGFDVDAAEINRRFGQWGENRPSDGAELHKREDEILQIFVDLQSLFCRHPEADSSSSAETASAEMCLFTYLSGLRSSEPAHSEELPPLLRAGLEKAIGYYDVHSLERSDALEESLFWIHKSHQRSEQQVAPVLKILEQLIAQSHIAPARTEESFRRLLDRLISVARDSFPLLSEVARELRYRCFDQPLFEAGRRQTFAEVDAHMSALAAEPDAGTRREKIRPVIDCPQPLVGLFAPKFPNATPEMVKLMLEVLTSRYYRIRKLTNFGPLMVKDHCFMKAEYDHEGKRIHVFTTHSEFAQLADTARLIAPELNRIPAEHDAVLDFYLWHRDRLPNCDDTEKEVSTALENAGFPRPIRRIVVAIAGPGASGSEMQHFTYRFHEGRYEEEKLFRGLHPMIGKRLHLWRLNNFKIERLPSMDEVYLIRGIARDNPKDERLFACAEVRDVTAVRDESGRVVGLPYLERMLTESIAAIRTFQSRRAPHERLYWNRILLYVWQPLNLTPDELRDIVHKLIPETEGAGLEQVVVRAPIPNPETGELRDMVVRLSSPGGSGLLITFRPAAKLEALRPLSEYEQKVVRMRQRGMIYPYEIIKMLTPSLQDTKAEFPAGDFVEHDLDGEGGLMPVTRPFGQNKANIIIGVVRNFTPQYPEGMKRVVLLGDPSKDLGALAEPECRRILAGLDLAEMERIPLEWFPISAGARISMESGVENMDWIARVLRRLVEFTQAGGEVNLVVNGINVGAQPYWNAEATMLMHTRGILIMTPKAAMVLTGKRALEFSGSVSAEDNLGIGGYGRIMGINGQGQYWAHDIEEACHILLRHYEHTYVAPGEQCPRRAETSDPIDRDVRTYPHGNNHQYSFACVGDIFSDVTNPGRKKSFDIRKVMMALIDQDHAPLERWPGMRGAETTVIWDAHLGGYPICLIGIESRQIPRTGFVPADGPEQWTAGTLFPMSSKKVARALNAASNNRPVVLLANLAGFDGSPESMRRLQLEYGAEIGRAVVNFKGPLAFCVINRYHGGAYVVFSRALNENLEVFALEGTYASVIGGAPAAAVVFAGEVEARARKDPRIQKLDEEINQAENKDKGRLRARRNELFKIIHSQKLGDVAEEFDRIHSVERARRVGALNEVIPAAGLRPHLIASIERGFQRIASASLKERDVNDNVYTIREHEGAAKAS